MNQASLLGRLTRDIELRYTPAGKAVGNFTLAVTRDFKNQNDEYESDFFDCVVWGKQAETLAQYTKKGQRILISGRLQKRFYENAENIKIHVTEIIVEKFSFIEKRDPATTEAQPQFFNAQVQPQVQPEQAQPQFAQPMQTHTQTIPPQGVQQSVPNVQQSVGVFNVDDLAF